MWEDAAEGGFRLHPGLTVDRAIECFLERGVVVESTLDRDTLWKRLVVRRVDEALRRLDEAFSGVKLGKGVGPREASMLDNGGPPNDTPFDEALRKGRIGWRDVTLPLVLAYSEFFSFTDGPGFRWGVAGWLRVDLLEQREGRGPADVYVEFALSREGPGGSKGAVLDDAQRRAVAFALSTLRMTHVEHHARLAAKALANGWVDWLPGRDGDRVA